MSDKHDCDRIFALLSEYLDAEAAPGDCQEIERHIAGCKPCVEFLESLKKSVRLSRAFQTPEPPPPLSDDVRASLRAAYRKSLQSRSEHKP